MEHSSSQNNVFVSGKKKSANQETCIEHGKSKCSQPQNANVLIYSIHFKILSIKRAFNLQIFQS